MEIQNLARTGQRLKVDLLIPATGFRPYLGILRELRLELDPIVEAPRELGALIDPEVHSCGTVPAHGAAVLAHPEKDFYIAGMKSYGRAPTFLLATGYEQVRSIVAALAGGQAAAQQVYLLLPETGVCSTDLGDSCGLPAINETERRGAADSCCGAPEPVLPSPPTTEGNGTTADAATPQREEPVPCCAALQPAFSGIPHWTVHGRFATGTD